jgi:molybdopterin converting factor small subunit
MPIKVHLPTPLRPHADNQAVVETAGATVGDALTALVAKYPGLQPRLFDGGQPRRFINFYLNDEDIRYLDNLSTPVKDGDALAVIPAVAGGTDSKRGQTP